MATANTAPQLLPTQVEPGAGAGGLFGGGINPTAVKWAADQQQRYNQVTGLANLLNHVATNPQQYGQDNSNIAGGMYLRFLAEKNPYQAIEKYTQQIQQIMQDHQAGADAASKAQAQNQPPSVVAPQGGAVPPPPGSGAAALPAQPRGQIGPTPTAGQTPPPPGYSGPTGFAAQLEPQLDWQSKLYGAQFNAQTAAQMAQMENRKKLIDSDPELSKLPDYVKASVIMGQYVPVPFKTMGGDIMTGAQAQQMNILTINGQPPDPNQFYRSAMINGVLMAVPSAPTSSVTTTTDVTDPNSPTGVSRVVVPRSGGQPTATIQGAVVPSLVPKTSTTQVPINLGGTTVMQPKTTTTRPLIPGAAAAVPPPPGSAAGAATQPRAATQQPGAGGLVHTLSPEQLKTTQQPMFDAENRLLTMTQNLKTALDSIKAGKVDQQAMLSLAANHLGMTTGAVRGMRQGQQLVEDMESSAPGIGRIEAHFSPEGYLTGIVLTEPQMRQMVGLAVTKYLITRQQIGEQMQAAGTQAKLPPIPPNVLQALGVPKSAMNPPPGKSLVVSVSNGQAGLYPTNKLPNPDYVEVK